jgi:hypothetical protein
VQVIDRASLEYQPFYCEENVWHLARRFEGRPAKVVFISNAQKTCALWQQRAAEPGLPVIWDYHVVLSAARMIHDLDTRLPFPSPAREWIDGTFPLPLPEELAPRFRVVSAARFVEVFASDRSHMRDAGGAYRASPPPWAPIGIGSNLMRFADMSDGFEGEVCALDGLLDALSLPAAALR